MTIIELTLERFLKDLIYWLNEARIKCQKNGIWWDASKKKTHIKGLFIELKKIDNTWVIFNSGVYSKSKVLYGHNYIFRFKGINWSDEELKKEATLKYKEFLIKTKLMELNKDFE